MHPHICKLVFFVLGWGVAGWLYH
ncbi:uncharacterized protein METZ01_LOCUS63434 [marine metagenome]|uniref:Uncharacterized protein n=1 Tax=marine metagenome TaxID=408172 RepID=A0A381T2Y5_9ZZZZ